MQFAKNDTVKLRPEFAGRIHDTAVVLGVVKDAGPNPKTWVSVKWDRGGPFQPVSVFAAENLELVDDNS